MHLALFQTEALALLPYIYWLKLLQAHKEFMEDLNVEY